MLECRSVYAGTLLVAAYPVSLPLSLRHYGRHILCVMHKTQPTRVVRRTCIKGKLQSTPTLQAAFRFLLSPRSASLLISANSSRAIMSNVSYDSVPTHPVPPRMRDGAEVPYIGPNLEAYKKAHAETVGPNADKWWAQVSLHFHRIAVFAQCAALVDGEGAPALGPPLPDCPLRLI